MFQIIKKNHTVLFSISGNLNISLNSLLETSSWTSRENTKRPKNSFANKYRLAKLFSNPWKVSKKNLNGVIQTSYNCCENILEFWWFPFTGWCYRFLYILNHWNFVLVEYERSNPIKDKNEILYPDCFRNRVCLNCRENTSVSIC